MNRSPISFIALLNRIIGRTMRQLQLNSGATRDFLKSAVVWLNRSRRFAKEGHMATAKFCLEAAMVRVANAKAHRQALEPAGAA